MWIFFSFCFFYVFGKYKKKVVPPEMSEKVEVFQISGVEARELFVILEIKYSKRSKLEVIFHAFLF